MRNISRKLLNNGGYFLLFLLLLHVFLSRVVHAYTIWPPTDIPMHFLGGFATAFFISRCFQDLPLTNLPKRTQVILEVGFIFGLTAAMAVFWEFQEFLRDQLFGSNIQVSLRNTMQDLAMGILGASVLIFIRLKQVQFRATELIAFTQEWIRS
jgi:hypothetical protein